MFTIATRKFGVWREERQSNLFRYRIQSRQLVFALSMAAFISWMLYIITIRVRQEFYLFESSAQNYVKLNDIKNYGNGFFINERKSAIAIYVTNDKQKNIKIIFDTGVGFSLPKEAVKFLDYFEEKRQNIMLTSMLMRVQDPSISRIKIWSDKSVPFNNIKYIIKLFSQFGYDDFDIAVER